MGRPRSIPTTYRGVRFRSRLEARWAIFFDSLGVTWRYESEGFELPSGRYLPDFWLPEPQCWVEIKGQFPTPPELRLAEELTIETGQKGVFQYGDIGWWLQSNVFATGGGILFGWDELYMPCLCPKCGRFAFHYEGRGARVCRGRSPECIPYEVSDDHQTPNHPRIIAAVDAANAFRFWDVG